MQKTLLLLILFFLLQTVSAQEITLSPNAEISVLTIGPGTSLNDAFGHSGFRIKDQINGLDVVYGYGEYDFVAPNFYLKFAQGKLDYLISRTNFSRFLQVYQYYDRTIREQVLNLTQSDKQELYDYLINNYKPENRRYLYDFFFDNCATKIKDVTKITLNNSITFNNPEGFKDVSFRTLIQDNLNKNTWGSLGIDLALGSVIDRKALPEDHMFLPKNIFSFFAKATYDNDKKPLVKDTIILYQSKQPQRSSSLLFSPLFTFGVIAFLIIFITYKDYKRSKLSKWLDIVLFTITGIVGIFLLLLWFATDHQSTHQNYNLLWAFALNVFVIGQFFKKNISIWFLKYIKLLIILLCLLTLHWIIGVQVFAIGLIPFLIALMVRYLYLVSFFSK